MGILPSQVTETTIAPAIGLFFFLVEPISFVCCYRRDRRLGLDCRRLLPIVFLGPPSSSNPTRSRCDQRLLYSAVLVVSRLFVTN